MGEHIEISSHSPHWIEERPGLWSPSTDSFRHSSNTGHAYQRRAGPMAQRLPFFGSAHHEDMLRYKK